MVMIAVGISDLYRFTVAIAIITGDTFTGISTESLFRELKKLKPVS